MVYVYTSGADARVRIFNDNDIADNTRVIGAKIGRKSVRFRSTNVPGDEIFLIDKL